MSFTEKYTKAFRRLLPAPLTIAIILTIVTYLLSLSFGNKLPSENILIQESVGETLLISSSDNTEWTYFDTGNQYTVKDDTFKIKHQKEILEEFREIQKGEGKRQSPKTASWFDGVKSFVDDLRG